MIKEQYPHPSKIDGFKRFNREKVRLGIVF